MTKEEKKAVKDILDGLKRFHEKEKEQTMTDNDIIKALVCCIGDTEGRNCFDCPLYEIVDCQNQMYFDALDLITRQKAEIEEKSNKLRDVLPIVAELKAEAITEFAERLAMHFGTYTDKDYLRVLDMVRLIGQIAKELKGEQKWTIKQQRDVLSIRKDCLKKSVHTD